MTEECFVTQEVNRFFAQEHNWQAILRDQGVEESILLQVGTTIEEWVANMELIALHFDLMLWWHNGMKAAYECVYLLACIHLPLPDSNGNQERTFSAAGWYDGKLNQNQNAATFEMKTLLHQN